jgi:hypothetical protein
MSHFTVTLLEFKEVQTMWNLEDNSDAVLAEIESKIQMGLEAVGIAAEDNVVSLTPVDTGRLKGSITHVVNDHTVVVGTNVEYAQAVELGHSQKVGQYVPEIGKRLVNPTVPGRHYMRTGIQQTNAKAIMSAALHTR